MGHGYYNVTNAKFKLLNDFLKKIKYLTLITISTQNPDSPKIVYDNMV